MSETSFSRLDDEIDYTLLKARRLFFATGVTAESAAEAVRRLWYLELQAPGEPITFVIASPGGSVDAGFAIWDQAKLITSPITTLVTGMAASMGSVLSLCAEKGRRFATPNSRIMIHQPSIHGGIRGTASDIAIQAEEVVRTRERIAKIYMDATGKDHETISKALDRDKWLTPQDAIDFGLLDKVVESFSDLG